MSGSCTVTTSASSSAKRKRPPWYVISALECERTSSSCAATWAEPAWPPKVFMFVAASCHICCAVLPTKVRNMAANSSLGANSSLESIGGGTTSPGAGTSSMRRRDSFSGFLSQCVSRKASCAVPGSSTTELRGRGSGMAAAGAMRMSTSPLGPSSKSSTWVWVCVPVRPPT